MGDMPGFDPCACMNAPGAMVNRLLQMLQNAQDACTDSHCFENDAPDGASGMSTTTILIVWLFVAAVLFLARPKSLRAAPVAKDAGNSDDEGSRRREPPATSS
eukprot:TRINITY_DN12107_c1_g2_i1.p2 TRINITY_DN12107_c1_g2~~TRINITY_DN12107_c1_g2_i1.p2  ORF type:complete len:103 (+),score=19.72 TRINITY_DN12107_c1_g2_i1:294-602(+)